MSSFKVGSAKLSHHWVSATVSSVARGAVPPFCQADGTATALFNGVRASVVAQEDNAKMQTAAKT